MEYALEAIQWGRLRVQVYSVLILVLMEYALEVELVR